MFPEGSSHTHSLSSFFVQIEKQPKNESVFTQEHQHEQGLFTGRPAADAADVSGVSRHYDSLATVRNLTSLIFPRLCGTRIKQWQGVIQKPIPLFHVVICVGCGVVAPQTVGQLLTFLLQAKLCILYDLPQNKAQSYENIALSL